MDVQIEIKSQNEQVLHKITSLLRWIIVAATYGFSSLAHQSEESD